MPYALIIVLNEVDYLDEILSGFAKIGVKGATILDSQGMARAILNGNNRNIPLFGSLKTLLGEARPYSKTIFTVLENEALADIVADMVREVLKNAPSQGTAFMFTVPIGKTYPLK